MPRAPPSGAAPTPPAVAGVPIATPGQAIDLQREYDRFFIRCTTTSLAQELVSSATAFLGIGTLLSIGLKVVSVAVLRRASAHAAQLELANGRNVSHWTELEVCPDTHWSTLIVQLLLLVAVVVGANQELALALLGGLGPPLGRRVLGVEAPPPANANAAATEAAEPPLPDGGSVRFGGSSPNAAGPVGNADSNNNNPSPPQRPPREHEDHHVHMVFLANWASCPRLTQAKRTVALAMSTACTLYCTAIVSGPNDPDMGPCGCTLSSAVAALASGSVLNAHRRMLVKLSADTVLLYLSTAVHSLFYHCFGVFLALLHVLLVVNSAASFPRLYLRLAACAVVVYGLGLLYDLIVPLMAHFQLVVVSTWDLVLPCTLGRPTHLLTRTVPTHDVADLLRGWPSVRPVGGAKTLQLERLPRVSASLPTQSLDTMRVLATTLFGLRLLSALLVSFGFAVGVRTL